MNTHHSADFFWAARNTFESGDAIDAGKLICENLSPRELVAWAVATLKVVIDDPAVKCPEIINIASIADDPTRWTSAHDAFRVARRAGLELDKVREPSREQHLRLHALCLAELVAKVTYNATNPDDEFDEDSGWWIVPVIKDLIDVVENQAVRDRLLEALFYTKTQMRSVDSITE
jgi:hypothetical protein